MTPIVPDRFDMAILGSGLAAAAAGAIAARLGARVLLLVRPGAVDGFGEVIDAHGLLALNRMELRRRVSSTLGASVAQVRLQWPPDHHRQRAIPGSGTICSATSLTQTLRECAVSAGACVVEVDPTAYGAIHRLGHQNWKICLPVLDSSVTVDRIIDATGRGDWVQTFGVGREEVYRHTAVHVVGHRIGSSGRGVASMLISASADGWSYRLAYPGPQIAGAVFRGDGALTMGQAQVLASALMRMDGGVAYAAASVRVVHCELAFARRCDGPGWIAIGGAALGFDPLSGQGMGWALESAWQGVHACLSATESASQLTRYRENWAARVQAARLAAVRHYGEAAMAFQTPYWVNSLERVRGAAWPLSAPTRSIA